MAGQRRHEAPELGGMVQRVIRSLVARAAEGDTEAIEELATISRVAGLAVPYAAQLAHERMGYSYTELAGVLGVTRQAARQRALGAVDRVATEAPRLVVPPPA